MRTELYKARSTVAHEAFGWDIYRIFYQYVTKTSDSYSNCMSYGQLSLVSMRDLKRARRQSNHSPKACRSLTSDALRQLRYETHKLRKLKPRPSLPRIRFQYAPSYLRKCSSVQLREIKRFSRNGGPDLSDIFGHPAPPGFDAYSYNPTLSDSNVSECSEGSGQSEQSEE